MTEMRWLKRSIGKQLSGNQIVDVFDRVLQYRVMQDNTIYAHASAHGPSKQFIQDGHRNMGWSAWMDVKEVIETSH
jgi:hypothetical protein